MSVVIWVGANREQSSQKNGPGILRGRTGYCRGRLLGLAAGDALGTTLEFRPPATFEPVTGDGRRRAVRPSRRRHGPICVG